MTTATKLTVANRAKSEKWRRANLKRAATRARAWRKANRGYSTPYVRAYRAGRARA